MLHSFSQAKRALRPARYVDKSEDFGHQKPKTTLLQDLDFLSFDILTLSSRAIGGGIMKDGVRGKHKVAIDVPSTSDLTSIFDCRAVIFRCLLFAVFGSALLQLLEFHGPIILRDRPAFVHIDY